MTDNQIRHLPLDDVHREAGARFGPFAGWSMPLTYPPGVMREHLHTRAEAGLFDISHMKLLEVSGAGAGILLDRACPLASAMLPPGQSKYSLLLNDNAGILDDVIVTRLGPERFVIVVNAGNAAADEAHLRTLGTGIDTAIQPLDRVFLALQGPQAEAVLREAGVEVATQLAFMHGAEPRGDWFLTRSGYTGEDGFEIALPEADARDLVPKLLADGRAMWVGLAARDSLRLEAGLCLHGNDIAPDINPVEAGLMWAIPKNIRASGTFVGAAALRDIIQSGASQKRVGLKPDSRQPVRAGVRLFDAEGNPAVRVTSGGFGPSAGYPVAMGYVTAALAASKARLYADVRGTKVPLDVHTLPFTPHRYRK